MNRWPSSLTRLHRVFGTQPAELREEHLQRLVHERVRENDDLDYKRQHYEAGAKGNAKLAGDVAGLANDRGGVIVLGIEEDENEAAKELRPVDIGSDQVLRVREVISRRIAPHVQCEIVPVPSANDPNVGCLLIVVPASPRRPHAVVVDDNHKYPRRHGTSTRYLSESEIADMYRGRWAAAQDQVARAETLSDEGLSSTAPGPYAILSMALAPEAPGRMIIDADKVEEVRSWLIASIGRVNLWEGFFESPRVHTGRRRLIASSADTMPSKPPYCELHSDGAGFAAARLYDYVDHSDITRREDTEDDDPLPRVILSNHVTLGVARELRLLGLHAQDHAGAYGDAAILTRITAEGRGVALAYSDAHGFVEIHDRLIVLPEVRSEVTLPVDALATDDTSLLAAAWIVTTDLFQSFGVPEARLVSREGRIRGGLFSAEEQRRIRAFAQQRGVELDT